MIERPILFNGEMVRAILDGSKTQTRRIAKLNASGRVQIKGRNWHVDDPDAILACPLGQAGDHLWVRETFIQGWEANDWGDIDRYDENGNEKPIKTWYRADGNIDWEDEDGEFCENTPWRPSIHMPRWASRIDLEITNVRIERIQEISINDCWAEGINHSPDVDPLHEYKGLWDSIYKNWHSNPWVWSIEFKVIDK